MKKVLFTMATCLVAMCLWTGCGDNEDPIPGSDPNKAVPDPEGTILVSVRNGNNGGGGFSPDNNKDAVKIDAANNFYGWNWQFATIGEVKGLGNVVRIPNNGWTKETSVRPGYGYVAAYISNNSVSYTRMYVEQYMIATTGGVIGADIRYQSPFTGTGGEIKIQGDKDSIAFDIKGGTEEIMLTEPVPYSVTTNSQWFSVTAKAMSIEIRAQAIPQDSVKKGKITIQSKGFKTRTITVVQGEQAGALKVSPSELKLSTKSETAYLNVESDSRWRIECEDNWCTFTPSEGMGNTQVKVMTTEAAGNRSTIARFYTGKSEKATVTISQAYLLAGEGTAVSPYQIKTADDLAGIKSYLLQPVHFKLMNDINLTTFLSGSTKGWTPIGNDKAAFKGFFHGNGHVIKGLWINDPSSEHAGLFGHMSQAEVEQLGVETDSKGITGGKYVGAICGYSDYQSKISQCYSKGNITGDSSGECYAGGIAGKYFIIENCYSEASVHIKASTAYAGGICGLTDGYIKYCYSIGKLSAQVGYGQAFIGGITSDNRCNYSYYDSQATGLEGGSSTADMKKQSTYNGWDFNSIWSIKEGVSYPVLRCFAK